MIIEKINNDGLFNQVLALLRESRTKVVHMVNQTMTNTYFHIGRLIVENDQKGEKRAKYGNETLKELSAKLTKEFGKGFSVENLDRMRKFYLVYSSQISSTLLTKSNTSESIGINYLEKLDFKLSWSHYLVLMRIENVLERQFYEIEALNNNWSLRELKRQYDSSLYERLSLSRDKESVISLSEEGQIIEKPSDAIKDPYILEFLGFPEKSIYSESEFEQSIIDKLEHFLLELGKGFTFVGRQVRFTFDEKHFRVDLVFYNRILQCFVLIDLKIGEIAHQDIGQMQMYVNYYDRFVKLDNENKTVGIILCKEKNDTLVEITLPLDNEQIFASKYQTILPSKEQLIQLLENQE